MIEIKNLLDTSKTIAKDIFCDKTYPYEVLPLISEFIIDLQKKLDKDMNYRKAIQEIKEKLV